MAVRSRTLPAWWHAASGVGTTYRSVVMPSRAWRQTAADASDASLPTRGVTSLRSRGEWQTLVRTKTEVAVV